VEPTIPPGGPEQTEPTITTPVDPVLKCETDDMELLDQYLEKLVEDVYDPESKTTDRPLTYGDECVMDPRVVELDHKTATENISTLEGKQEVCLSLLTVNQAQQEEGLRMCDYRRMLKCNESKCICKEGYKDDSFGIIIDVKPELCLITAGKQLSINWNESYNTPVSRSIVSLA
jgi:hypothetical protein